MYIRNERGEREKEEWGRERGGTDEATFCFIHAHPGFPAPQKQCRAQTKEKKASFTFCGEGKRGANQEKFGHFRYASTKLVGLFSPFAFSPFFAFCDGRGFPGSRKRRRRKETIKCVTSVDRRRAWKCTTLRAISPVTQLRKKVFF